MITIFSSLIGGIVSGIGSAIGGIFGAKGAKTSAAAQLQAQREANQTNIQLANMTNRAQMDLARYSYDQELAQWERENAYNTPAQQMSRYREAGLNPYLAMGDPGNAGSSPQYSVPDLNVPQVEPAADLGSSAAMQAMAQGIRNSVHDVANTMIKEKQLSLMDTQQELLSQKVDDVKVSIEQKMKQMEKQGLDIDFLRDTLDWRKAAQQYQSEQSRYNRDLLQNEIDMLSVRNEREMIDLNLQKTKYDIALLESDMTATQRDYFKQHYLAELKVKLSEAYKNFAQGDLNKQQSRTEKTKQFGNVAKANLDMQQTTLNIFKQTEQRFINGYLQIFGAYPPTQKLDKVKNLITGLLQTTIHNTAAKDFSEFARQHGGNQVQPTYENIQYIFDELMKN